MQTENIALYAFRKYGDTALQAAFCCLGNQEDAEDVAQEVFFELHKKPRSFNDDEHLKAYILRAVINRCNNLRRKLKRRIRISLEDVRESELIEKTDSMQNIIALIKALPPPYNAVVYLHDCAGYSAREIAEMLGRKENTVSSQLRRGREKLRMDIEDAGVLL
ncbi:MAG: sigma-70 family RNA polymerase sigma factor [Oscillospiraceae bacterium]|nr:sigma-70 family RNA polymerase sigma factor [Oscillospiraceae bacterium]